MSGLYLWIALAVVYFIHTFFFWKSSRNSQSAPKRQKIYDWSWDEEEGKITHARGLHFARSLGIYGFFAKRKTFKASERPSYNDRNTQSSKATVTTGTPYLMN